MRLLTLLLAALAAGAVMLIASLSGIEQFILESGVNIPTTDVVGDYTWGLIWSIAIAGAIAIWPMRTGSKKLLLLLWAGKMLIGLIFMLPYEEHYGILDSWSYYQAAQSLEGGILPALLNGSGDVVVAIGALHAKVGLNSYHAMKMTFSLFGLIAVHLFYRATVIVLGREDRRFFWLLALYPSVLFWSSIFGKDPIVLFGIALHVWGLMQVSIAHRYRHLVTMLAGVAIASLIRVWMGPILMAPAMILLLPRVRHTGWRIALGAASLGTLAVLVPTTADRLDFLQDKDLFESTQSISKGWKANSSFSDNVELTSLTDLILFTPQSMFIAYFRPLPGDLPHAFGLFAGCENLLLLLLVAGAAIRLRLSHLRNSLCLWAFALLLIWGVAYGLVTYKDLGTAVRFKLQILPVLLGAIYFLLFRPLRARQPAQFDPRFATTS
ncbi:MAG: hypothetical protein ABI823_16770 [Bryobacteraceae bacterium]